MKQMHDVIRVRGARENNLKNVSLDIPKKQITVFTGVSGSGKSSLVFDTIAAESQRQLNETFTAFARNFLPSYGQPDADSLENLSAAIVVDQKRLGGNARSTVGTITDIYALLRLWFSRIGQPFIGYSNAFSFNDPQGMCPECDGLGQVSAVVLDQLIDRDKSLNEGAIMFPQFAVDTWYWRIFAFSGFFDNDKKLRDYSEEEWETLLRGEERSIAVELPTGPLNITYEGLLPKFKRLYLDKDPDDLKGKMKEAWLRIVTREQCPLCQGARLSQAALGCLVAGKNIAECASWQLDELAGFVRAIDDPTVATLTASIIERLEAMIDIGLGYLTLSRETTTLSGGESQRVKMVRHLGSSLTDMTYIFDEPSIGLHPHDVYRLNDLLQLLRDKGNTILVVEHDPDVIAIGDHIVDMGPDAGRDGGEIVYEGDIDGLRDSGSRTGRFLSRRADLKQDPRPATGSLRIAHATLHNLQDVSVEIPTGVMTVVTGVAGSGKSTLIQEFLPQAYPDVISIDQGAIRGSRRSNPATYTGLLDPVRKLFAKANKVSASLFSPNSEGACPECQGLGVIYTDLAFMDPIVTTCEICQGRRFTEEVLKHELRGKNIGDVFEMDIATASEFFHEKAVSSILARLVDVGLGYITLGQAMNTLSGGERQRIKLASELENSGQVYIFDEPTSGLHMSDVDHLIGILDRLVNNGSTVIVIEHNLDVMSRADWIIDLGPGAGHEGGKIVFEGTPADLVRDATTLTGEHLARHATANAVA